MRLVFASNNAHKLDEVRAIMPAGIEVLSLREVGFDQEIDETGSTLEENSAIKARAVVDYLSERKDIDGVFADDTGLEIDALNGQPGVYTARWYKRESRDESRETRVESRELRDEHAIFAANRAKALRELEGKKNRGAQFKTVITLIRMSAPNAMQQVSGIVRGHIATQEFGQGGFGYDPIFIPEGYDKSFGELPATIKNDISHRARAMAQLVKILSDEK